MRFVNEQYKDLAEGYQLAKQLEAKFWEHKVYTSWKERRAEQRRRRLKRSGILAGLSWLVILCCFMCGLIFSNLEATLDSLMCFLTLLVFVVALGATVYFLSLVFDKGKKDQRRWSICLRWFNTVFDSLLPTQKTLNEQFLRTGNKGIDRYTRYGAYGVLQTLRRLNPGRGNKWFILTNVMFSRSEDADIVLVGPAGIWVLESKYWSGYINIEKGKWSRVKVYYESGGRRKSEHEWINKHWDDQWQRQRDGIVRILNGSCVTAQGHAYKDLVHGGVVLSHPKARLNADGSQKAPVRYLSDWNSIIPRRVTTEALSLEESLDVIDRLLAASRSHQKTLVPCVSAVDLAQQIGIKVVQEAYESNRPKVKGKK